ncbi:hypothetical protein PsYK624_061010 [Phanerochaete sordida]|uniref:Uncharacterized protein n=1 Tax=Phanerochaete sordida TaxID=48140 RepID=A0A9P3LDI9_9APHY|nr:hypothetical protein PsYK624_061010 [Phanerochaete sordida]
MSWHRRASRGTTSLLELRSAPASTHRTPTTGSSAPPPAIPTSRKAWHFSPDAMQPCQRLAESCSEASIAQASVRSDTPCGPRRWACRAHPSGSDVDTDPRTHFAADLAGVLDRAQHTSPQRLID